MEYNFTIYETHNDKIFRYKTIISKNIFSVIYDVLRWKYKL